MDNNNVPEALKLRQKYKHFRILVIGRANAGKTTLLKRVCNTDEDPCVYDEEGGKLLEPTSGRGVHNVNRPFAFKSNPEFIFHDSPGFEAGGEEELTRVREFIEKCGKATEVEDQLHAIWFCVILDKSRPLHNLEKEFFNKQHTGNVPVIAIFTKFDTFYPQVLTFKQIIEKKHESAFLYLRDHFQKPLEVCLAPPKAYLCLEAMDKNNGNHQQQVKELMQKTADSLDDPALKLLFVSIQKNNLELCIQYAVKYTNLEKFKLNSDRDVYDVLQWFRHAYYKDYDYGKTENVDLNAFGFGRGGNLSRNSKKAKEIMDHSFVSQALESFVVLVICAEHSYWLMYEPTSLSFEQGFQKAFEMLTRDEAKAGDLLATLAQVSNDMKQSGDYTLNEWKKNLITIILQNRLHMLDLMF